MSSQRILIIEDCKTTQALLRGLLTKKYLVTCVSNTTQAEIELSTNNYSLIILDVSLPEEDGFQFCARLKNNETYRNSQVVFLTSRDSTNDKVLGFSVGADDYIVKPIDPPEFQARIGAKMRRLTLDLVFTKGIFKVSMEKQKIYVHFGDADTDLFLTSIEFKLLVYFLNHEEHVLSRENILNHVWGINTNVNDRTIDTHVYTLRKKLGIKSNLISAIPGVGYSFSQTDTNKKNTAA